jgi:hypothetical protein
MSTIASPFSIAAHQQKPIEPPQPIRSSQSQTHVPSSTPSSASRSVSQRVLLCRKHNIPCIQTTTTNTASAHCGRKFWTCALPKDESAACKTFCWVGEENVSTLQFDFSEETSGFAITVEFELVKENWIGITHAPYEPKLVAILKVIEITNQYIQLMFVYFIGY